MRNGNPLSTMRMHRKQMCVNAVSEDGQTWSEPLILAPQLSSGIVTSGGMVERWQHPYRLYKMSGRKLSVMTNTAMQNTAPVQTARPGPSLHA